MTLRYLITPKWVQCWTTPAALETEGLGIVEMGDIIVLLSSSHPLILCSYVCGRPFLLVYILILPVVVVVSLLPPDFRTTMSFEKLPLFRSPLVRIMTNFPALLVSFEPLTIL